MWVYAGFCRVWRRGIPSFGDQKMLATSHQLEESLGLEGDGMSGKPPPKKR